MRRRYLALTVVTIAAGLASRALHTGSYLVDKSLGDALYAAMIYWLLGLAWPRTGLRPRALVAVAVCFAIEAFKFTGLPLAWSASRLSRLIFGTTPSVHNLVCYVAGVAIAWAIDARQAMNSEAT